MCPTGLSVWFVCRLCRGSFGQVDAFIEHKKQKHFNEFRNSTSIVFEETELGQQFPLTPNVDSQLLHESNKPTIKFEVNDEDPINPFSSEIIDEPNLDLLEPKSELITYEGELNGHNENNLLSLKQQEQNPYVLLKRLTSKEILTACVPQHLSRLLPCEPKDFAGSCDSSKLLEDVDCNVAHLIKVETPAENELSSTVTHISTEDDLQFECKLCSKQLQSAAQLKNHVGICAL